MDARLLFWSNASSCFTKKIGMSIPNNICVVKTSIKKKILDKMLAHSIQTLRKSDRNKRDHFEDV